MKLVIHILIALMVVSFSVACETADDSSVNNDNNTTTATEGTEEETQAATTSIDVTIGFDTETTNALRNALGTSSDISTVTVAATDTSTDTPITSTSLEKNNGVWQGALEDLPYNVSILFTANAYDTSGTVIFTGETTQTMAQGQDNDISIQLESIDDGLQPNNPAIVSASLPENVLTDGDPQLISFSIQHTADIDYSLEVIGGKAAASADDTPGTLLEGTHNPATDLEFYFFPPSVAGKATLTLTIKDTESSDTIGASFYVKVISYDPETWTDGGVSVIVGPSITGMEFYRTETTLKVTVLADSSSDLTYTWNGTGSFDNLVDVYGNPIFITDFTDDMTGELAIAVTDENGLEAFMTRTIEAGDFPYVVTDYIADMPGIYIFDETTGLLWEDSPNDTYEKWENAKTYCAGLSLVDYTTGWRLPTRNELSNMYQRRSDFYHYLYRRYWTADEWDRNLAYLISFSDGSESVDWKKWKFPVRCVKSLD